MNKCNGFVIAGLCLLVVEAAEGVDSTPIAVDALNDHLHQFTVTKPRYTVNMLASVGVDGLLLIDTGQREYDDRFKAMVDALGVGTPAIIINTHEHVDHVGGNEIFGEDPLVIGHEILRTRLVSGPYLFEEYTEATLPDLTITDAATLHFNGDTIRIRAFPGAHDDNDLVVHFVESKIAMLGDLSCGMAFPSADEVSGNALMYAKVIRDVLDWLPRDVTIVPGHGANLTWDDLAEVQVMLGETIELVREELASGRDADAIIESGVLEPWAPWGDGGYITDAAGWVYYLAAGFEPVEANTIFEPMFRAYKRGGVEAAGVRYRELKADDGDDIEVLPGDLFYLGFTFANREMLDDAIGFLEMSLEEESGSPRTAFTYLLLGECHRGRGDLATAREYARKALALNPEHPRMKMLMRELTTVELQR